MAGSGEGELALGTRSKGGFGKANVAFVWIAFSASESQQGLSLLASLSAFYPTVDVLHSGWMAKRRERNVHNPKSIMTYWKRHFFVFLTSGDLLYFRDDTLGELQGRVDVRHAPTVRVTGEQLMEERKKDGGMFKFGKMPALERA